MTTVESRAPVEIADTTRRPPAIADSIARGALALLGTQPLTWAATLLTATLGPRLLGAEWLGQVTLAGSIATLATTVTALGIPPFLIRRVAQEPGRLRPDTGTALLVQTVTSCIGALVIAGVAWFAPGTVAVAYPLLLASLIPLVAGPAQTILGAAFRGTEQHAQYAWFNALSVVACAVGSTLVLMLGGDAIAATTVYGVLFVAATLAGWRASGVRPTVPRLDPARLHVFAEFIRGGLPFMSWEITLAIYGGIDRLILGAFVPVSEIGWYAAAYRIVGMTVFVPTLVVTPLFPVLSRTVHDALALRRTLTETLRLLLVVMGALAAVTIAVAPGVPALLGWPADFDNAVPLMCILALHLPVVALDMVLGVVLMAIHRERRLVLVGVGAAVFNISLNLIGIPAAERTFNNGAIAAALITVLTEIFMCIGAVALIPKHLLDPRLAWVAVRLTIAGVIGTALGALLLSGVHWDLPLLIVLGGVAASALAAYAAVAVMLRALTLGDCLAIKSALTRKRSS